MSRSLLTFASLLLAFGLVSCSNTDQKNLFEAQICIDHISVPASISDTERQALSSQVDNCMSSIASKTTTQAYVLKCAGEFIRQGIAETSLISAVKDLNNNNNSVDPSIAAMDALAFSGITGKYSSSADAVSAAVTNCTASQSNTLEALAGLSNISTTLKSLIGVSPSLNDFITNYTTGSLTSTEKINLANTIINSSESLCDPNSGLFKGNEFCQNVDQAAAAGTATDAEKEAFIDAWMANNQNANN